MTECSYLDPLTSARLELATPVWCSRTESGDPTPLMLTRLPGIKRDQILNERSLWRYSASFPLACEDPISLGEGCTPLIKRRLGGNHVHIKCEGSVPALL